MNQIYEQGPQFQQAASMLTRAIYIGLAHKLQPEIFRRRMAPEQIRDLLVTDLSEHSQPLERVVDEFTTQVLPLCKNEASPSFLGFGDTGDDLAALVGGVLDLLTGQNLINQSFDSPAATFTEIAVLRWLRGLLGYVNAPAAQLSDVWQVGGVVMPGGTASNTVAMMLAREHAVPGTMQHGVRDPRRFGIVVPRGIGHYSVKSALTWIGVGAQLIEVDTAGYRYDIKALTQALHEHAGRIMSVVAYAGDSRSQTIEDLATVAEVVRSADPRIWLHADACWGLLCALSDRLRPRIAGITEFDSITVDPHKVLGVPYNLSALLVREPHSLKVVTTYSDLIMQERFAFGQVTPFLGSRGWWSLKLWMLMRTHGQQGLAASAEHRCDLARHFADLVDARPRLLRLHEPDLLSVMFVYLPAGIIPGATSTADIAAVNHVNRYIHARLVTEGHWYLHQFSVPDDTGALERGALLYPLRFMAANPRIQPTHMRDALDHVIQLGDSWRPTS